MPDVMESTPPTRVVAPALEMRGISKAFSGVNALRNVDFLLYPGEVHALMGENGAGKSTLMKILSGLYQPTQGEIILNGEQQSFSGLWCKHGKSSQAGVLGLGVDHAASTALQISGAVLFLMRSLPSLNCPFLIRCMSSMPAIVVAAWRKCLRSSIGPSRSLTDR
jgi:ABC-type transporter Mla maintaining outer membrane lipid asymmetry ATPase subunit MlaF